LTLPTRASSQSALYCFDLRSQNRIEVEKWLKGEAGYMAVVLIVMSLIPGEGLAVVYLKQRIATPASAVGLDVAHATFYATPIAGSRKALQSHSPRAIEIGLAAAKVLKTLEI
jgi:hypothetical protein